MFCLWEKPSELDVYFETSCMHEYPSNGRDENIKKCPYCNSKVVYIDKILDKLICKLLMLKGE